MPSLFALLQIHPHFPFPRSAQEFAAAFKTRISSNVNLTEYISDLALLMEYRLPSPNHSLARG